MLKQKKAVTPIVVIVLLLLVAVVSGTIFNTWVKYYGSSLSTEIGIKNQDKNSVMNSGVINVIGGNLFFRNSFDKNIELLSVKIGLTNCNILENITPGINTISLSDCLSNASESELENSKQDLVIITSEGTFVSEIMIDRVSKGWNDPFYYVFSKDMYWGNASLYGIDENQRVSYASVECNPGDIPVAGRALTYTSANLICTSTQYTINNWYNNLSSDFFDSLGIKWGNLSNSTLHESRAFNGCARLINLGSFASAEIKCKNSSISN